MSNYATRLENGQPFEPFNWQFNEVIWASVKAPYQVQWRRWRLPVGAHGGSADLFTSNWTRAELFSAEHRGQPEGLNKAAQHAGKLAAGLTCSLALFNTPPSEWSAGPQGWRPHQFRAVDSVLAAAEAVESLNLADESDIHLFEEALVAAHEKAELAEEGAIALHDMSVELFDVAARTTRTWLDFIETYDGQFVMTPGGVPRSSGEFIDQLWRANQHLFEGAG